MGTGACALHLLGDLKHGLLHAQLLKEQLLLDLSYLHLWHQSLLILMHP